jgi:hypothetical protein
MAVQVPPEVNWLLDILCGQSWPEGDEDALRRCAQAWQEAAQALGDLAGYLDSSAQHVLASADSMSADDYNNFWKNYIHDGDGTYVDLFKQCEPLVKQLFAQANEVEYTKIVIVVTLILTAIQIAIAIAAAAGTFGGSLAEVGLAMFIGRQTILMVVARFVEMALMMLIPDLVAQTVMFAQGHGWDGSKTAAAFENALAAGTIAAVLGPLAGKLPWMSEEAAQTIGGKVGALATHFVEGGAVNDLTALTTMGANYGLASLTGNKDWQQQIGQQWSSTNWVAQFAQGGVLADAFYFPHMFGHDGVPMTFTGSDGKSYTVYLNDGALTSLRDTGQLPTDYQARVFGENGVKVGDATFNGTAISFDKPINGQPDADLGGGFTVAGPDGSQFRFHPSDQTGPDGRPQYDLVSRVQKSADPIAVPNADTGGDPLEFPPGSVVHYDNVPGPDGTMTGHPYRVEVTEGNVMKIYQAEQPGGPFELTGQVVHSNGILRFFGADAPKYYGPGGPGDGAQPLATVSLITGKTTTNDLPGYLYAHMDRWGPNGPTSPAGAAGPQIVDGTVVTQAHDGTTATPANDGTVIIPTDDGQRASQEADQAAAVGLADASTFAYVQQLLQAHPKWLADLGDLVARGGPAGQGDMGRAAESRQDPVGLRSIDTPRSLAQVAELKQFRDDFASALREIEYGDEPNPGYQLRLERLEQEFLASAPDSLSNNDALAQWLDDLTSQLDALKHEYLDQVAKLVNERQAGDLQIIGEKTAELQADASRQARGLRNALDYEARNEVDRRYQQRLSAIRQRVTVELERAPHLLLDRLYQREVLRVTTVRDQTELDARFADLHDVARIGLAGLKARRWAMSELAGLETARLAGPQARYAAELAAAEAQFGKDTPPFEAAKEVAQARYAAAVAELGPVDQTAALVQRVEQRVAELSKDGGDQAEIAELRRIADRLQRDASAPPRPERPAPGSPIRVMTENLDQVDHAVAEIRQALTNRQARSRLGIRSGDVGGAYKIIVDGIDPRVRGLVQPVDDQANQLELPKPSEPGRWIHDPAGGNLENLQRAGGVPKERVVSSVANRIMDTESRLVDQALRDLRAAGPGAKGVLVIGADKLMCPSCQDRLNAIMDEFPGVQVVLASGTETVALSRAAAEAIPLAVFEPDRPLTMEQISVATNAEVDLSALTNENGVHLYESPKEVQGQGFDLNAVDARFNSDHAAEAGAIMEALRRRAEATGRFQAVVANDAGERQWVEGGTHGFTGGPGGRIVASADAVHRLEPTEAFDQGLLNLRAALDPRSDAFSQLAAALRMRAATTGRMQAIVEFSDGSLQWVQAGKDGEFYATEPDGQRAPTPGPGPNRVLVVTAWNPVDPARPADAFPPSQFDDRIVIPLEGDAYRLNRPPELAAANLVNRGDAVSHPVATDGHSEVPSGFSHVDLPAGHRLAGLVHKMPDRVAGYAASDQKMIELVRQVPGVKGAFLVDLHGDAAGPWDPGDPLSRLSVSDVHDLLIAAGWDGKQPVVLMSCDTARSSYAADLAAELGVRVIAPTERVWQIGDRIFICGIDPATGLPDLSKPGHWQEFGGDNPGPAAVDEHGLPVLDAPHPDEAAADAQQVKTALRVLSERQAHAPPVPRGEDDPFGRAGGDERAVWLDKQGRPLLPAAGRVSEDPPWYHGPRTHFYAERGPDYPRNEIAIYALYDRQTHEFLKIGISDDPLSIRYRHGERAEDDRPVEVFVIGKFKGLPTGNKDWPWQTSRPAVEAVERYLIERWPGAISKDYLRLPTAAVDRAAMDPAELREMQDLLTRPERDWPATPQAKQAFIDELSSKVRGYVGAAIAERISEISGQRTLSADDRARLAVLRVAEARPLDDLFTMRQAGVTLFNASYYDHPLRDAIRSRLYGEPVFADPTLNQLRGGSNRLTEQADLLEKVITQVPIRDAARAVDAAAGLARIRDLARQLQDAALEQTAGPSGTELRDLMAEATKIRDGILADARRPGGKARDQVDAIFKSAVAGLELMPALRRSEPYELYLQWLVSRRPELAPVADLVQRLGSEQWADWANAAKCVHSALAYEVSRRLGQVVQPTELPPDRVSGIASGRQLAELASVWGPGTRFSELEPAQFGGAAGALRRIFAGFGDGARGLVAIGYADGTGHVVNVENVRGRVVFPDALDGTLDALYRLKGTAVGALPGDAQGRYDPKVTQVPVDYVAWLRTDDRNPHPQALAEFIKLPSASDARDLVNHDLPVPGRAESGTFTDPAMARTMGEGGQNPAAAELPRVTNDLGQVSATGEVVLTSAISGTRPWVLEVGGHSDWLGPAAPVDVEPSDAAWPNVFSYGDATVQLDLVRWPGRMDAVVVRNAADIAERIDALGAALRPGGLLVLDHGEPRALAAEGSPRPTWVRADAKDVPEGYEKVYSGPDRIVLRKLGGGLTGEQPDAEPDVGRLIAAIAAKHEEVPSLFPSPLEIEERWGFTQRNQKLIQWIVDKEDLLVLMRPGNVESAPMQEAGGVTKPPALKANTINEIDVMLGARDLVGAVGFYRPDLEPAEAARAQLEQAGRWDAVQSRYNRRLEQYNELLPKIEHLILERKFRVVDGVIYPFDPAPVRHEGGIYGTLRVGEPELDEHNRLVAPVFADDSGDTRLRPVNLWPRFNRALGVPVTGDYDIYHVLDAADEELPYDRPQVPNGEVAPSLWFKKLVDEGFMTQDQIRGKGADAGAMLARQMGIQHGAMLVFLRHNEITDWERQNIYEPIIKGHQVGGTPLLLFQAGRRPTLVYPEPVPAEVSRSPILDALNPPGGHHNWLAAVHGLDLLPAHLAIDPADVPADLTPLTPPTGLGDLAGMVFARADGNGVVISSDPEHLRAAATGATDDAFRLYAAGGGGQAWAPGSSDLSPEELFALAKEAGWDGSRALDLVICQGGAGDEASLAARVQAVARSEFPDAVVRGATDWVWQDPATGERVVAPAHWDPATGHFLPHRQLRGTWVRFPPDGNVAGQPGALVDHQAAAHWVHWAHEQASGRPPRRDWPADPVTGEPLTQRDLDFLGLTEQQVEWWRSGDAPLGMTPDTYHEWTRDLQDALREDGIPPETVDVRLLGSSARGFSGPHKHMPSDGEIAQRYPQQVARAALERKAEWLGEDTERLQSRPFDSMNKLGLDEPSDYDTNISCDLMVAKAREQWQADGEPGAFLSGDHEYVNKNVARETFPHLRDWADRWTARLGREVSWAVFPSTGPKDVSASGHFVHFQDDDWIVLIPGGSRDADD